MKLNMDLKEMVSVAAFGAIGGAIEISIGSLLHSFTLIPFKGLFLGMLFTIVLIASWIYIGRKSAPFFTGMTIAFLKIFSFGGVIIWPMIAIAIETVILSTVILFFKNESRLGAIVAGVSVALWTFAHPFVFQGLIAGMGIFKIYQNLLESLSLWLGDIFHLGGIIISTVIVFHILAGIFAGIQGFQMGKSLQKLV